jgi:serine/threonine protein phosphatase PrpC
MFFYSFNKKMKSFLRQLIIINNMSSTHTVTIQESVDQLSSGQDQTAQGVFNDGETGQWAMVTDGHGTNTCITFIRSISQDKLNEIVSKTNPVEELADYINLHAGVGPLESSGATMCLVKVYADKIVCINAGDSQAAVYKNENLEFITAEHNPSNLMERERLDKLPGFSYLSSNNIQIISPTQLRGTVSQYACWSSGPRLATTQALGHNGRTGYAPDVTTIYYGPTDAIQVVIGSDGLWDMVNKDDHEELLSLRKMTSDQILQFATNRWKQWWNMAPAHTPNIWTQARFTTKMEFDDVCAVKIDVVPEK